jgi:superfamily II DNA or RNA helicase
VDDLVAEYGQLIVDECHHLSAVSFEAVARRAKAKFVLGLSATVTRKDGHHPIIFMQCGPVRFRIDGDPRPRSAPSVIALCRVVRPSCFRLILTERKDHALPMAERVSRFARNVIVLTGGMGAMQRRAAMQRLGEVSGTDERVLIATGRYIGEGFDDARLDTLFLAMPISWKGTLAQYVGRLHRLYPAKREVIVYDYVDETVPLLKRMSEKRDRGYKGLGYSIDAHPSSSGASAMLLMRP